MAGPRLALSDHLVDACGTALELLPRIREIDATVPVVVLTGHATIDLAVRAVKEGADQFLAKPVELKALRVMLRRLLEGLERIHIERVLRELGGRVTQASQRLGIPRSTLYQKLKRYGIAGPRPS